MRILVLLVCLLAVLGAAIPSAVIAHTPPKPEAPVFTWLNARNAVITWDGPGQLLKCRGDTCAPVPGAYTDEQIAMHTSVPGGAPVDYFYAIQSGDVYMVERAGEIGFPVIVERITRLPLIVAP